MIEFGVSNSSLPKGSNKVKPPQSLTEVFGRPTDIGSFSDIQIKEYIDKKAKEFWAENAKIFSIGRSLLFLQITKDNSEILLVP